MSESSTLSASNNTNPNFPTDTVNSVLYWNGNLATVEGARCAVGHCLKRTGQCQLRVETNSQWQQLSKITVDITVKDRSDWRDNSRWSAVIRLTPRAAASHTSSATSRLPETSRA